MKKDETLFFPLKYFFEGIISKLKIFTFWGYILNLFWISILSILAFYLAQSWRSDLWHYYAPRYISGIFVTLKIVFSSFILGFFLACALTQMRFSKKIVIKECSNLYDMFLRGSPLLVQTYLIYYGIGVILIPYRFALTDLGVWMYLRDGLYYAIFAFTLNTAAYQSNIFYGAVKNIPVKQWEGGQALALSTRVIFIKIILPQALVSMIRPLGNEIIFLIKSSAIVTLISVFDIMGETRRAYGDTYDFQFYVWTAIVYYFLVEIVRLVVEWMDRLVTFHLRK